MSFWQRMTDKRYPRAEAAIDGAATIFAEDLYNAVLDGLEWTAGETGRMSLIVMEEMEALQDELEKQTPLDPGGPNDPPLHAKDAWRLKVTNRGGTTLISVSNPKDYIGFLEDRGGRVDHPGANVGGWISDAFNHFTLRIQGRLK